MDRQCGELLAPADKEGVGAADHEHAGSQLVQSREDPIEIAVSARMQDMEPQPEGARRRLQVPQFGLVWDLLD